MGASVVAYWPGITEEQLEEQPGFYNDCKAWGDWMAEREGEPDVIQALNNLGVAPILTSTTDGVEDEDVYWVTPRELYIAADKLQDAVRQGLPGVARILEVYGRHGGYVESIEGDFIQDLEDIKALARWAEKEDTDRMTLEVNW
jgi:hypothetical protein